VVKLILFIALIFSPFAAATAFVITYAEYAKRIVDQKSVLKRALKMALVAFVFFLIVPPLLIWLFMFH